MFPSNSQLDDVVNDADDGSQQIHDSHSSALDTQEEAVSGQSATE